ncbi:hypothetical protein ABZU86_34950, partial [Streptomyces sp. NPDC005271]|uniref:hypothetical protein n=1 Tax=Streptomyces sp. NPDC005271 TaxID=3157030 RepID=UPI0033BF84F9
MTLAGSRAGAHWPPQHLLKGRCTMYDLTSRLELTATSEDSRVPDALAHARRHKHLHRGPGP